MSQDLSIAFSFIESHESLFRFESPDKDESVKVQAHISNLKKPLSTPIVDILDNGSDVLICGEAGSGKTTNLQAYTLKLYNRSLEQDKNKKFIFYSTLNDVFSVISSKNLDCISEAVFYILMVNNYSISLEDFREKLKNEDSTLILDSIDECISTHKNTLELISSYKEKYPRSQIITSSRHTIEKTLSLGFSCISILPFTKEQKKLFFRNWLEDEVAAQNIIDHLNANKYLDLIIDNPLNATILAVLYENKVKLPSSESSLYQRRFELISGKLDQFKGIQRTNNTSDDLVAAASFIAFEMHKLKIRKITEEQANNFLLNFPFELESRHSLFSELVKPCEIILKNEDGTYDFGHLKFQEYLASKDLDNRRSMNFSKILSNISWWEETLFLYAQHARDISWIVNYVCIHSSVKKHYYTLSKLVELWRGADKTQLTKQIEAALRTGSDYDD